MDYFLLGILTAIGFLLLPLAYFLNDYRKQAEREAYVKGFRDATDLIENRGTPYFYYGVSAMTKIVVPYNMYWRYGRVFEDCIADIEFEVTDELIEVLKADEPLPANMKPPTISKVSFEKETLSYINKQLKSNTINFLKEIEKEAMDNWEEQLGEHLCAP